jgi:hypothetical protein
MRVISKNAASAAYAFSVAVLAACSGGGLDSATATRVSSPYASPGVAAPERRAQRGWISHGVSLKRDAYVADGNEVLIFPESHNPPLAGEITDGVEGSYGLCVDRYGNLYVANDGNDTVTEYAPGATTPSMTYSLDLARPLYPMVDSHGNLWVTNADTGTVVEYRNGKNSVNQVLQTPGVEADGLDFDPQGNLYVAYRGSGGSGSIEEFPPGSSQGTILGMTLNQPQSVVVTSNGTILTVETGGTDRIDVFPPGYQTPTLEVGVKDVPTELAITSTQRALYISSLYNAKIYVSPYPLLNPNGSPNVLHEKIDVGRYGGIIQGLALSNGQVF